ncbi:hypothetical protein AAFF_G00015560 [Aldrovandia affinis]|uniref:A-kinase interacting protein 1 n=1 Tax=Aldrovandia affinis TaxID=143900 RepID=A0AAD7WH88_9TELE|nr:hypothetical protein AAFF_G00015560 [Aldrovandia affinis]
MCIDGTFINTRRDSWFCVFRVVVVCLTSGVEPMSSETWMESSLRRSSRLGLQVLERARRRSVDWASASASPSPPHRTPADDVQTNRDETTNQRLPWEAETREEQARATLDDAFQTIVEFMAQTTHQCKNFYESAPVREPSQREVDHARRYHSRELPGLTQRNASSGKNEQRALEDFHIEVPPGTYAITARAGESDEQTHMVQVEAGESVDLTFHL